MPVVIVTGVVVYIVLCGIIASSAAETGRSGGAYFFLSLLLSPLVAYISLTLSMLAAIEKVSEPKQDQRGSDGSSGPASWECPECGKENPGTTLTCEKCGHALR